MTEASNPVPPKASRRTLVVLLLLFFAPLAAAFFLYYQTGWRPAGSSNNGELLQPVRQLPAGAESVLHGVGPEDRNWALVYVGDGKCDEDCRRALVVARQTRLSLNQEMTRVNRVFFATSNCCDLAYIDAEHKGLKVRDAGDPEAVDQLLSVLPAGDHRYWLYIVDPLGNFVMRYDVRKEPRGLYEDIKKLLKLSHIG
jgi:hypothetical protein